jgi:hypothetical protein
LALATQPRPQLTPVVLQLLPGRRLEANRANGLAQRTLGMDIFAQNRFAAPIALLSHMGIDHLGIPNVLV